MTAEAPTHDTGLRRWRVPVLIGLLCAAFGLCVHLAGWLVAYRLFEQGRGCAGDESGYAAGWVGAGVAALVAPPLLAWFAARSMRMTAWRPVVSATVWLLALAPPVFVIEVWVFVRFVPFVCDS